MARSPSHPAPVDDSGPAYPTGDIGWLLVACEANKSLPPGDPRHHDFTKFRGMDVLTELEGLIGSNTKPNDFHHRVLCGHRGSGKSTELRALKQKMDAQGFLSIWIEVDLSVGLDDLEFSDLYVLAAGHVAREMESEAVNLPLPSDKLQRVIDWFAEVTEQKVESTKATLTAEAGAKLGSVFSALVGGFFAKLSAKGQVSSERRRTVKHTLRSDPTTLVAMTNDLLATANSQLQSGGWPRGLLLMFDSLDRFDEQTIRAVLLDGSNLIREMASHAVFTMPINLYYNQDDPYQDCYGTAVLLPMLALRSIDDRWAETVGASKFVKKAIDEMVAALAKRIDLKSLLGKAGDATLLAKLSGGCMREMLHLVCLAYQKSLPDKKVTHKGVEKAVHFYRSFLTDGLLDDDFRKLAAIASQQAGADTIDAGMRRLLRKRIVFRYWNGKQSWADVHPLVIETEGFRRAKDSASPTDPS